MRVGGTISVRTFTSFVAVGLVVLTAAAVDPAARDRAARELDRPSDVGAAAAKVWVCFADKGVSRPAEYEAAIARVATEYNPRAVQRRALRGEYAAHGGPLFDEHDLSVVPAYVDAVASTGAQVLLTSRWLNAVSVRATDVQVQQIAELACVAAVRPVVRYRTGDVLDARTASLPAADGDPPAERDRLDYGLSTAQLAQINVIDLHDTGYTGAGVIVGVLDTGFRLTHRVFHQPGHPINIVAEWDFVDNDANPGIEPGDPLDQHEHGSYILGTLAAYMPGSLVGGAYDAGFILCKVEDAASEYPLEEDWFAAGLEFIEANGGDVATSSLVANWYTQEAMDGQTSVMARAWNLAAARGLHGCQGAGNSGHDASPLTAHLAAPADAFKVITVGAVDADGFIASFSSDGPTRDGRVKPEVLARGVDTYTLSPWNDTGFEYVSGTSLSTPLAACAVACLVQAYPGWSVDEMRARLFRSANYYVVHGTYDPMFVLGYGLVDALGAYQAPHGELNCDGVVNFADINPFVLALSGQAAYQTVFPNCTWYNADCNDDGTVNFADINPFVALLSGA